MAAARLQRYVTFERLSRKNGVASSPPDGVSVEVIVLEIGNVIGFDEVRVASWMNKRVIVFVSDEEHVALIIQQGLSLDSGDTPAQKVVISNVPPFLSSDVILRALKRYGHCVSPLIMLRIWKLTAHNSQSTYSSVILVSVCF